MNLFNCNLCAVKMLEDASVLEDVAAQIIESCRTGNEPDATILKCWVCVMSHSLCKRKQRLFSKKMAEFFDVRKKAIDGTRLEERIIGLIREQGVMTAMMLAYALNENVSGEPLTNAIEKLLVERKIQREKALHGRKCYGVYRTF